MEQESAKNGKEYMIMMSTMIWVSLTRNLNWLVKFLGDRAISLTLEGEEPAEEKLKQVRLQTLVPYFGLNMCFLVDPDVYLAYDSKDFGIVSKTYIVIVYVNRS
jgi:hypothetical protein